MRLNRLDLTRYGRFTDTVLNFGPAPGDGPDLHIIHGPNEAGKSTLLSAWLDLLFQIPARSPMDFLHDYSTMRIGAELAIDGQPHQVVRVKATKAPLLDSHGNPLPEALLQGGLRGLNRDSYAAMFSLNGQTLIEGGESILASKGDLGQLLFSASAGLADLTGRLDGLRAEAEVILSDSGRKGRLLDLKRDFDALGDQMRSLDTAAGDHAKLVQARNSARTDLATATTRAEAARTQANQLDRMIGALPLARRFLWLAAEIDGFGDLPAPPQAWIDDLPALDRAQTEFATRIALASDLVAGLTAELDLVPQDAAVPAQAAAIAAAERLKSGYDTALDDLPRRVRDRDAIDGLIADRLQRLGQAGADPQTLLPEVRIVAGLRALIGARSGVETALAAAGQEAETARQDHDEAQRLLTETGGGVTDTEVLGRLVARLRRDDPQGALDRAWTAQADEAAQMDAALAALRPWVGSVADLAVLAPPDAGRLDGLRTGLAATMRDLDRCDETVTRLGADVARAGARIGAAGGAGVSLDQAATTRAERERLWTRHRDTLDPDTADGFERAMRLDDQVTAALASERARAEKTAEATQALAELRAELDLAQAARQAAETRLDGLRADLGAMVRGICPALPEDIDSFTAWLGRLDTARAQAARLAAADRSLSGQAGALTTATDDLRAALGQAGAETPPETGFALLLETAQALLDRGAAIAQHRKAASEAASRLTRRVAALDRAGEAEAVWTAKWAEACAATWMTPPPDVAGMGAVLDELAGLQADLAQRDELDNRIAKMQDNRDGFADAVAAIAARLDLAPGLDPADAWAQIARRQRGSDQAETTRSGLADKLAKGQSALAGLQGDAALHRRHVDEIAGFFNLIEWADIRAALTRAGHRAGLIKDRDTCAGDLCDRLHTADTETALAMLKDQDEAEMQARTQTLESDMVGFDATRQQAHSRLSAAETALTAIGGDDAVARIEARRQTLLMQIEDGARSWLRHRLGLRAVDHALRRYRDSHRSGMLDRASDAFRAMTGGRYGGLAAQPDGAREVLMALAAGGGSKSADQLSDGTRGQLYLALRIAGYHEFAGANGPVPFIADDIMESFDDDRTAEAMKLLAETSRAGQVIYLTHHDHVCRIATAVCPGVRLHRLDP
jgi:uncharacterized protein YhaN